MKILALSDVESRYLWDYYTDGKLDGIDLIISCGDLKPQYLSFLATFTHAPVLYVHGNHDDCYDTTPPDGCICIDDTVYDFQGIKIVGLGGSMRYKPGHYQYTEKEMAQRIRKLAWKIKFRGRGRVDILVTHAPALHINDEDTPTHRGFQCFRTFLEKYRPKYFLHGHIHQTYGGHYKHRDQYEDTLIINPYERCTFIYETGEEIR